MATPTPSVWICDVLLPVPCTGFRATVCHVRPGAWAVRDFPHEYDHAFPSRTACSRTTSASDWRCCAITSSLFLSVIKQYIDVVFCGCFFCTWTWWIFFQALDLESVLSTKISTDSILQLYIRLTGEGEDFILSFRSVICVLLFKCLGLDFFVD